MLTNFFDNLPRIDLVSFLAGLVLGAALYVVSIRLIRSMRQLSQSRKKMVNKTHVTSSTKILSQYKLVLLKKAQSDHLLGSLFPLSEVYVPIPLIYPYSYNDPSSKFSDTIEASSLLPFVPELPEFYETIPFHSIKLSAVIKDQKRVLLQGKIGSGKTTAINQTISNILESTSPESGLTDLLPVCIHYSEIDLDNNDEEEPHLLLFDTEVFRGVNSSKSSLISTFLPSLENGKVCIFLDGLDEAAPQTIIKFSRWLNSLSKKYPELRIVVTANLSFTDDFMLNGYVPFIISPLTLGSRKELTSKLRTSFQKFQILSNHYADDIPDTFDYWYRQNLSFNDVFSLTLACLYEFSLSGPCQSHTAILQNYIQHHCQNNSQIALLSKLAQKMSASPNHTLPLDVVNTIITDSSLVSDAQNNSGGNKSFLDSLVDMGFLVERQSETYGFRFLQVFAYLHGIDKNYRPQTEWENCYFDESANMALAFSSQKNYLPLWLAHKDIPLYRHFNIIDIHLEKIKNDQEMLNKAMSFFVSILQQNNLSLPVKLKALSLIIKLGADSAVRILDFLPTKFENCKIFSILGYGFYPIQKSISSLKHLNASASPLEKALCAVSLLKLDSPATRSEVVKMLISGNDLFRRLVCEMLSTDRINGHPLLKELTTHENIAIRKSSIFGIKLIDEPWVAELLTNLSTIEGEWLVRDSAAAALEEVTNHLVSLNNSPLSSFETIPWLLEAANKRGQSISSKVVPNDLLFDLINTGNLQEKLASLYILSRHPNQKINDYIVSLLENNSEISDQAYFYLAETTSQDSPV